MQYFQKQEWHCIIRKGKTMGYTGIYHAVRKSNGSIDRRATLERDFSAWENGDKKTVMLKSGMQGTTFYAAMETTGPAGREVWALVIPTRTDGDCFLYKEMDETEGPCYYTCPVSILNLLTPTENEIANDWREKCRQYHAEKKAKTAKIPRDATELYITFLRDTSVVKAGQTAVVVRQWDSWVYYTESGHGYRVPVSLLRNSDYVRIDGTNVDKKPVEDPAPVQKPAESSAPVQTAAEESAPDHAEKEEPAPEKYARKPAEESARCYTVVVRLNDTWADIYINGKWDFGCRLYLLQHHMAGEKEYYPDAVVRYKIERGTSNRSMHRPFIDSRKARTDGRPIIAARRNKSPVQGRTGPRRATPGRTTVISSFCSQIEKSRPPN